MATTALEELKNYRFNVLKIKDLEEEIAKLKSALDKTMVYGNMPSVETEKISAKYARLLDLKREYNALYLEIKEKCVAVEKKLKNFDDQRLARILSSYYFEGKTLEKIAEEMNFSCTHIKRLKSKADKKWYDLQILDIFDIRHA